MVDVRLSQNRLGRAKRAFVTRRAKLSQARHLGGDRAPRAGDLCLAVIKRLGHHSRLELVNGRRARLFVGDEIIVAYGDRYATDQFDAAVPPDLRDCRLVAAGGIASAIRSKHSRTRWPTRIKPLGLLCRKDGDVLNLKDWAIETVELTKPIAPHMAVVVGSGMNAGKTTTVSLLIRAAKRAGLCVGAIKITGTGAGGDMWSYKDSGADILLDFTDVGYASTVGLKTHELEKLASKLYAAAAEECDIVIAEIADGLYQTETAALLHSSAFQDMIGSILFSTRDPLAAREGVRHLHELGLHPAAISGRVTDSRLARAEAEQATGLPVLSRDDFERKENALNIALRSARPVTKVSHARVATNI